METPSTRIEIRLSLTQSLDNVKKLKCWREKYRVTEHVEENFFNKISVRRNTSRLDDLKFEHIEQSLTHIETPAAKLKNVKKIRKQEKPKKVWVSKMPVLPLPTPSSCGSSLQHIN